MSRAQKSIVVALVMSCAMTATAQAANFLEMVSSRVKGTEARVAMGPDLFGEQTSLSTGATEFRVTDVQLPTNSGLKLQFGRRLDMASPHLQSSGTEDYSFEGSLSASQEHKEVFGKNWDLDIPSIHGVFDLRYGWVSNIPGWIGSGTVSRCSAGFAPPDFVAGVWPNYYSLIAAKDYWSGTKINIPGAGEESLLSRISGRPSPTGTYPGTTRSEWKVSCLPSVQNAVGEGFKVRLPNGTVYYFDWMVVRRVPSISTEGSISISYNAEDGRIGNIGTYNSPRVLVPRAQYSLYATRVEDRYGNWITYEYDSENPQRLLAIRSNENSAITLTYEHGQIKTVTAGSQVLVYEYNRPNSSYPNLAYLNDVVTPDQSKLSYSITGLAGLNLATEESKDLWRGCALNIQGMSSNIAPNANRIATVSITHPSGAVGVFKFRSIIHGTNRTIGQCGAQNATAMASIQGALAAFRVSSLYEKTISGPGLVTGTWSYSYSPSWSWASQCVAGTCATTSETRVTAPNGVVSKYVFGNDYDANAGQLLSAKTEFGGFVFEEKSYAYLDSSIGQMFADSYGIDPHRGNNPFANKIRPLSVSVTTRDGVTFTKKLSQFDIFARPAATENTSSLGFTRNNTVEYFDNFDLWVIGQIKRQYNNNTGYEIAKTEYTALAQPWKNYTFAKLKQILTYNTDGTVESITDGRGNQVTASNWKRGIPQSIQYPATLEAPTGATQLVSVNYNGWVTSTTDESNHTHGYAYDAMGRLISITYPTADSVVWLPKILEFRALTVSDWRPSGITVGQWRHYEGHGNYAKFTYYDAMWRPVLVQEYDTSNVNATIRYTRTAYDINGRVSFQSYPVSDPATATAGVRSFYDALDRVTSVQQDSEQGVLTTATDYLAGLKVRVTNPRNLQTTTSFMAWDQPSYDLPIRSDQPENKVIEISRHLQFGWPLQLKQHSSDNSLQQIRSYVYDGNAQLCKTIEPETGATVTAYDAANNPTWQAAGLTGGDYGSTTDCSYAAASTSGRVVNRSYDARNRIQSLNFPDGRGNQIWTYEKDSLPASVTAYNDPGSTTPVVIAYTYNKRRFLTGESLSQPGWYTWGIGYAYDGIGNLTNQIYPTGLNIDYAPNALGQATKGGSYASGAQYFPNGALKQFTYGNGIVHTMHQNARQLPQRVTSSGGTLDFSYSHDKNANVDSIWDHARDNGNGFYGRWMTYDGLDRLTSVGSCTFGGDCWHRFTYDALDNMKSWKLGGVKDYADYIYEAQTNRLTSIHNTAGATVMGLSYGAQGNLENKNGQAYVFDYGNRLRQVTGKEAYRYDGLGRRVLAWRPAGVAGPAATSSLFQYSQSGQMVYEEHSDKPNGVHVYLAGSLVATRHGDGSVKYQHTDALGSPVAVTNEAGQVIERNDYEPYGVIIGKPTRSGIGYTGHVMDGVTGLTYMQQRYYDQSIGRFLSVDPVTANSANGSNFNRFRYAANNPYRFTDPDGRAESPAWMRAMIPGQVTWDYAVTSFENGNYGKGAIQGTVAIAEGATVILTLGQAQVATTTSRAAVQEISAVGAARQASTAAQASGATGGATTGLVTKSGEVFIGASANAGGPGVATNPAVQKILDSLSPALRSCFHGGCGEVNAASNALNAGANVEGGVIATVRTLGAEIMEACPSCAQVADRLGMKVVSP